MTRTVNPQSISSLTVAFEMGFRSAQSGRPIESCPYATKQLREAWTRGYKRFEKRIREVRK